jgi:hypothetical protein
MSQKQKFKKFTASKRFSERKEPAQRDEVGGSASKESREEVIYPESFEKRDPEQKSPTSPEKRKILHTEKNEEQMMNLDDNTNVFNSSDISKEKETRIEPIKKSKLDLELDDVDENDLELLPLQEEDM